jgi:epoxide hydrolase-like predicted phosphatase
MKITTIIFDWGGVLIDRPSKAIIDHCAALLGVTADSFIRAYHLCEFDFYRDSITEPQLWQRICEHNGVDVPPECLDGADSLWYKAFSSAYTPRPEMFDTVARLKSSGYRIGLLSNTEMPSLTFFEQSLYDNFDFSIFSCVERIAKPDREIYELAAARAKTHPANCLFIDDRKENTDAAQEVGMKTILFESINNLKKEFDILGIKF